MRFGKLPARHDPRTLNLVDYLDPALPPPKPVVNYATKVEHWPIYANDRLEDCTCAAAGHLIQDWTANTDRPFTPEEPQVVHAYSAITGYNPDYPSTDKGAHVLDVLRFWRKEGIAGRKILAFVALEPGNEEHVKDAVQLFGGAYIGLQLPLSAENQTVWSVPPGGATGKGAWGSWESHAVPIVAYDTRTLTVVTWGKLHKMTWQFWDTYCDEAYTILSPDFIGPGGKSPSGVNLEQLGVDLEKLKRDLDRVTR